MSVVLDAVPPVERLRLVGALGAASAALAAAASPIDKIKAATAVRDLLSKLGAAAPEPSGLTIDLNDKAATAGRLREYLNTGVQELPEAFQFYERNMASALAMVLGDRQLATEAVAGTGFSSDERRRAAFDVMAAKGIPLPVDRDAVLAKVNAREQALKAHAEALRARVAELNAEMKADSEKIAAMQRDIRSLPQDQQAEATHRFSEAYTAYRARYAEMNQQLQDAYKQLRTPHLPAADESLRADGEAVIAAVMDRSPITTKQAADWAAKQKIAESTVKYLKKQGYEEAKLRADMADFYRLSGGKLPQIEVYTAKSGRAHADGVTTVTGVRSIAADKPFTRDTLFHELAHHLEGDAIARAAAGGFLVKRRKSPGVARLRNLTGNRGYRTSEVAHVDEFLSHYIGKVYSNQVTEVFAMGVQYLSNPQDAAVLAARDPEMFALISGYLTSEMSPAAKALANINTAAGDAREAKVIEQQDKEAQMQAKFEAALAMLAGKVDLVRGSWWDDLPEDGTASFRIARAGMMKPVKYIGGSGGFHVFEGTFRNENTRRAAKGHLVVQDTGGNYPDTQAVHGGLNMAKTLIHIARSVPQSLWDAWFRNFRPSRYGQDYREAIIEMAGEE